MKRFIGLFLLLFAVGCGPSTGRIEMASDQHQFYLESFEPEMITMRYRASDGQSSTFPLTEAMVVSPVPNHPGVHTLVIEYREARTEIWIELSHRPDIDCRIRYVAYEQDFHQPLMILDQQTFTQNNEEMMCVLDTFIDVEDVSVDGYTFVKFDRPLGTTFDHSDWFEIPVIFELERYEILFYDHQGDLIESYEAFYGEDLRAYTYDFPEYFRFSEWDQSLISITQSLEVHPVGTLRSYVVIFLDHEGRSLMTQHITHGEGISIEPFVPLREGYEHIGWSHPLDAIYEDLTIEAVYQRLVFMDELIDEAFDSRSYTVLMDWEGLPMGDGTAAHVFEVDGANVKAFAWEEWFYLTTIEGSVHIIAQYEGDDTWVKSVHLGETLEEFIILDLFALDDDMLKTSGGVQLIDEAHFETLFGSVGDDVLRVEVTPESNQLIFAIEMIDEVTLIITLKDVNDTEVTLPEYVDILP